MPANLEDVREWMAEGDRLMAQGYDYLHGGADDPLQMDLAGRHFSRAAQAYLAGGVEYQLGADAPVPAASVIDDPAALIRRLDGHLRVAGTIEIGGYNLSLDTPLARARCKMLADRIEQVLDPQPLRSSIPPDRVIAPGARPLGCISHMPRQAARRILARNPLGVACRIRSLRPLFLNEWIDALRLVGRA